MVNALWLLESLFGAPLLTEAPSTGSVPLCGNTRETGTIPARLVIQVIPPISVVNALWLLESLFGAPLLTEAPSTGSVPLCGNTRETGTIPVR